MSAKLMPQTPTVNDWLQLASSKLAAANIPTNRLDAEIILANSLSVERTYLHAHPEQIICSKNYKLANNKLSLRLKRHPIAYITGVKEFYGRQFIVTKNTLIPRPESESIINILKSLVNTPDNKLINLVDVGTGSGCLGITAKLELPYLKVSLLDISQKALKVAKINSKLLSANVKIQKNNLLSEYNQNTDIIIANLPYVDKVWQTSPETAFEPRKALYCKDNGQELIKKLIVQASALLSKDKYLLIEADPVQHKPIINFAKHYNFCPIEKQGYILEFKKIK